MSVRTNSNHKRAEEEGEIELVLVAVTYTGKRSIYNTHAMRDQGGYPALDQFRGPGPGDDVGETKLVELPSSKLGWWENHSHFGVAYDPETVARTLLGANYIPEQIVGPGYNTDIRESLTDLLDLDPFTGEEDLREQLLAEVGEDEDEEAVAEEAGDSRTEHLVNQYARSDMMKVAGSYDDSEDLLEQEDADQITHLKSTVLAEFLAGKDDDEVDKRLATAEQGGDL